MFVKSEQIAAHVVMTLPCSLINVFSTVDLIRQNIIWCLTFANIHKIYFLCLRSS